jgi:DNA mismatch repair ATPase MutS
MKTKKLSTYQSSRDLAKSLPNHILLFKAGAMVQVFDEDAILLNRLLGYKLNLLGANDQSYLRSGFPLTILDKVVKQIKSDLKLQIAF